MIWLIIAIALIWLIFIPISYFAYKFDFLYNHRFGWTVGDRMNAIMLSLLGPFNIVNIIPILFSWLNKKFDWVDWNKEAKW